jgi:hypothetical protein
LTLPRNTAIMLRPGEPLAKISCPALYRSTRARIASASISSGSSLPSR